MVGRIGALGYYDPSVSSSKVNDEDRERKELFEKLKEAAETDMASELVELPSESDLEERNISDSPLAIAEAQLIRKFLDGLAEAGVEIPSGS